MRPILFSQTLYNLEGEVPADEINGDVMFSFF